MVGWLFAEGMSGGGSLVEGGLLEKGRLPATNYAVIERSHPTGGSVGLPPD